MGSSAPNQQEHLATSVQSGAHRRPRYIRLIPDLRPGERVVMLQRQHPVMLFRNLLPPVSLLVVWLVSLAFVIPFISGFQPDPLGPSPNSVARWLPFGLWVGWIGLAVALCIWAVYLILDWSDDWVALTTRRLIVMDKALFFRETRSEAPIGSVQNVTADYPNSIGVALDFGNLHVDTAGIGTIVFENMPHAKVMREAIFAQQQALRATQPAPEDRRKAAVRDILHGPGATSMSNLTQNSKLKIQNSQTITWHKHWVYLLRGLIWPCLVWALAFSGWLLVSVLIVEQGQSGTLSSILDWVAVILAPVCLLWGLYNWEDWRNDLYRLDQERVYDIESLPFGLREQSKETLITRVTDVSYTISGPLAHLLDYGDVVLKTPGESTEFRFRGIPHPREVQQQIMSRLEEYRLKAKAGADQEIEAWLKAYHDAQSEGA